MSQADPAGPPSTSDFLALGCMAVVGVLALAVLAAVALFSGASRLTPPPTPVAPVPVTPAPTPRVTPAPVPEAPSHGWLRDSELSGPDVVVTFPPTETTLVFVWLQGCQDCIPAFEAHRDQVDRRELPKLPVVNVAYGNASLDWAERYHVGERLVLDRDGSAVVKPLGIGTFTTLLVAKGGEILFRGRPTDPGYVEDLRARVR